MGSSASTRLTRKGALVAETRAVFRQWDVSRPLSWNLHCLREENWIGAPNQSWLREVATTLSARFGRPPDPHPIITLAKSTVDADTWRWCLLWHIGHSDILYRRFALELLAAEFERGTFSLRTGSVEPFVQASVRTAAGHPLSAYGTTRTARDLLRMATELGLLRGRDAKTFSPIHPTDEALLFALHWLANETPSPNRLIGHPDWKLFLLSEDALERELLRLHQFRRLRYEAAGSVVSLDLPSPSLKAYVSSLPHV